MLELHTPVQYVRGVGPKISDLLAEKGITTVEDLLYHLPFRYEDRLNPRAIAQLRPGEMATVIGEVRTSGLFRTRRMPIFQMTVAQGRDALQCVWFNAAYLRGKFQPGERVALYGRVEAAFKGRGRLQLVQPQFEVLDSEGEDPAAASLEIGRIVPIYESAAHGKLTSRWFRRVIHGVLENLAAEIPDGVPPAMRDALQLLPRREAFWRVHWPEPGTPFEDLQSARTAAHRRLIFEELFFLEVGLELKRRRLRQQPGISFRLDDKARQAIKRILPFHPTAAQKRVLGEIAHDMERPSPMRRLLQGDVGSGKTIVALEAAIIAIENGCQAALMAPTEILATQHYLAARTLLERAGYRIVLLTGSLDPAQKRSARRHIARGDVQLVIGTHALIEEKVEFARLGLVIVDEQHRFGVLQRFRLMKKPAATGVGQEPEPDVLVMTATPIPRTLALTLYGDLDVSLLDEMPPGRSPIVTRRVPDERSDEVFAFVRRQVQMGHQAYVVYPVIEEKEQEAATEEDGSARMRSAGVSPAVARPSPAAPGETPRLFPEPPPRLTLKAAVKMYDELRKKILPDLRIGLLHGRLPADEKEEVMRRFGAGEIDVLVSTTVIEVGVDVANATVMVVEHAERFGLAQLHQLRGRIGRGAAKSYCILMTGGKVTEDAEQRLDAMVRTTNGFEIAELDLELRGPGEFFGTRQAGMPDFRVANLLRDRELLETARREAARVAAGPAPDLSAQDISRVFAHLKAHWQRRYGLVEVG
ncbi:MAG TPA: ATP-dependent DNA helicase RecG [Terriglobales bacterium]|nr:ATP-dependent DNA helicase RecG [Terriglobales bacterium]